MRGNKITITLLLLTVFTFVFIGFSYMLFKTEVKNTIAEDKVVADKFNEKQEALEQKKIKEAEEEKKRIYNKHKGEPLIYSPMGDSLALGLHATTKEKKYTAVLPQLIEENLGYSVTVADGATEGGTGLKDFGIPNLPKVIAQKPDLVTIEFGTNDSDENFKKVYSTPEEFEERLLYVINTLKSQEKPPKIILVTTWGLFERSFKYDAVIEKVGKQTGVPVANIQSIWYGRNDTFGPKGYKDLFGNESDGWHPNDQGHKEIANQIFEQAYEILK